MEVADTLYSSDSDPEFGEAMLRLGVCEGAKARTPCRPSSEEGLVPASRGAGSVISSRAQQSGGGSWQLRRRQRDAITSVPSHAIA